MPDHQTTVMEVIIMRFLRFMQRLKAFPPTVCTHICTSKCNYLGKHSLAILLTNYGDFKSFFTADIATSQLQQWSENKTISVNARFRIGQEKGSCCLVTI